MNKAERNGKRSALFIQALLHVYTRKKNKNTK
jgi:hypothetical protein